MSSQLVKFDKARADRETPRQDGWCQMYAERGFGLVSKYASAWIASQHVPVAARRKMTDAAGRKGCQVLIYFDGYFNGVRYGDIAVLDGNKVYSGASASHKTWNYADYVRWIGRAPMFWSEWVGGAKKVASYSVAAVNPLVNYIVTGTCNVRKAAKTSASIVKNAKAGIPKGQLFRNDVVVGYKNFVAGTKVAGNTHWVKTKSGYYIWSGNLKRK